MKRLYTKLIRQVLSLSCDTDITKSKQQASLAVIILSVREAPRRFRRETRTLTSGVNTSQRGCDPVMGTRTARASSQSFQIS